MAVGDYITYLIAIRTMQAAGLTLGEPTNLMCLANSSYRKALSEIAYSNLLRVGCEVDIRWNYNSMRIHLFRGMDWHQAREAIEQVEDLYEKQSRNLMFRSWYGYVDLTFPINEDELRELFVDIKKVADFIEYKKTHGVYPTEVMEIRDKINKIKKSAKTVSEGQKKIDAILKAKGFISQETEAVDNE